MIAQNNLLVKQQITLDAALNELSPQELSDVRANIALLKIADRFRCPACGRWERTPAHFGVFQDAGSDIIHTFSTCQQCSDFGLSSESSRQFLLDEIQRFFTGGAR